MRFAKLASMPAVAVLPIITSNTTTFNPSFFLLDPTPTSSSNSTLHPRQLPPGPYLPDPPWPVPTPYQIGCYLVDDGARAIDAGVALIAMQTRQSEQCFVDKDSVKSRTSERRCKILHVMGTVAYCICGPAGWGFNCGEMAEMFGKIFVPCRQYRNSEWRLTGQLTMPDGGWLAIVPKKRVEYV